MFECFWRISEKPNYIHHLNYTVIGCYIQSYLDPKFERSCAILIDIGAIGLATKSRFLRSSPIAYRTTWDSLVLKKNLLGSCRNTVLSSIRLRTGQNGTPLNYCTARL